MKQQMQIGDEAWVDLIVSGGRKLGVQVTSDHVAQFALYGRELLTWNRKINLTSITAPHEIALKHFVDSLAPIPYIDAGAYLLDVGCGAGFPGLPIKVVRPDISLVLIDGVRKKVSFVQTVIRTLRLSNTEAIQVRAEQPEFVAAHREKFQVVVCRALANAVSAMSWGLPFLAPGGKIILLKGRLDEKESKALEAFCDQQRLMYMLKPYCLPHTSSRRVLVSVAKA